MLLCLVLLAAAQDNPVATLESAVTGLVASSPVAAVLFLSLRREWAKQDAAEAARVKEREREALTQERVLSALIQAGQGLAEQNGLTKDVVKLMAQMEALLR